MRYEVTIDEMSPTEWELAARAFADHSIYQTWAYQQGRAETDHQQVHRVVIRDESGAVCSLCHVRVKAVEAVRLRVGYVQWGPLLRLKTGQTTCSVEMFVALREALLQKGVNILRLAPNLPADDAASAAVAMLGEAGFEPASGVPPYRTFRVDTHDNEEGIRARLRKSFRRDLKKAEETGLQVEHSHSEEAGQILESLYRILLDRKHFKGLDPQEFTQIQPALSEAEKLTFVVARQGSEPVAVLLSSNLGDTGIVLLAASNDRGLRRGDRRTPGRGLPRPPFDAESPAGVSPGLLRADRGVCALSQWGRGHVHGDPGPDARLADVVVPGDPGPASETRRNRRRQERPARQVPTGTDGYCLGTHPVFVLAKCLRRCLREVPYGRAGLARLAGLAYGYLAREQRQILDDARRYVRKEQMTRLRTSFGLGPQLWQPVQAAE
jgi:hypothetical protein